MEYNKNQYSKANDKKVLHKVKKQWVVMSMALLMAIGGGAVATKTSAHAATANNNGNNNTAVKANLGNKSAKAVSNQNVVGSRKVNASSVNNQASALHNRIMQGNSNKVANAGQSTRNYVSGISHQFNNANVNNNKAVNNNKVATASANKVANNQAGVRNYVSALNKDFSKPVSAKREIANEPTVGDNQVTYPNMEVSVIKIDGAPITKQTPQGKKNYYRIQSDGNGNHYSGVSDVSVSAVPGNETGFHRDADNGYTYVNNDDVTHQNTNPYGDSVAKMNSDADGAIWNRPDNYQPIALDGDDNSYEISSDDLNSIQGGKLAWDGNNNRPVLIEKAGNASNINVSYVDQSGKVIDSLPISGQGNAGDTINVTDPNEGGLALPDSSDYELKGNNIDTTYTFGSQGTQPQNVEIPVEGKTAIQPGDKNDKLTINYNIVNHGNGTNLSAKTISDIAVGHYFGDVITIDPKNYVPSGYVTNPNQADVQLYLNDNGGNLQLEEVTGNDANKGLQVSTLKNNAITFNYDGGSHIGTAKDITVTYKTLDGTTVGTANQKVTINGTSNGLNGVNSTSDFGNTINVADGTSEQLKNGSKYVKGVAVPQGYHLASGQDTNVLIGSDAQNLTYYVEGNQITTNSTSGYNLTIKPSAQAMKSNQTTNGAAKSYSTVTPKITAEVGQTFTLNPADYVPSSVASESGKDVEPDNDKPITITVTATGLKAEQTPKATQENKNPSPVAINPSSIGITYDVYNQAVAQDQIKVNYIAYNPTNNTYSNQIYNMNTNQYQSDFVSDKGAKGSTLSPTYYLDNVPRGYQLYGIKDFDGEANPTTKDIKFGGPHGSDNRDNLDIAVIPNIGAVTVYYKNQNGDYVDQKSNFYYKNKDGKYVDQNGNVTTQNPAANGLQTSFNPAKDGIDNANFHNTYTSRFGSTVNLLKDTSDNIKVPNGYTAYSTSSDAKTNDGEQYVFNNAFYPSDYTVSIIGNQTNPNNPYDEVKVNLHEEDPYGHTTGKVIQVIDHLNERVGDNYSVDASAYTPDNFSVDSSNGHETSINGQIMPEGASNREADFYYKSQANTDKSKLQPITVLFEHNGEQVGSRTIDPSDVNGGNDVYAGKVFNVETASYNNEKKTGWKLPDAPYALIANQNLNTSFSTTAQNPLVLNVYNTQQSDSSEVLVRVHLREADKSGNIVDAAPSYLTAVPVTGTVGGTFDIKPSDSHLEPKGFGVDNTDVDPGSQADNDIKGVYTSTGYKLTSGNNPTEYYIAKKSQAGPNNKPNPKTPSKGQHTGKAQPIWVSFINEANDKVLSDDAINGYLNQDIPDIAKAAGFGQNNTQGYHLVDTPNLNYHITDQVQQIPLVVKANDHVNPANPNDTGHTLPVNVQFENPSGANSGNPLQIGNPYISDNTTQTIQPSDYYGIIPNNSDYTYDYSNNRDKAVTVSNNHGTLTPNSVTFYFKAKSNSQSQNLQPIYVNYVNQHGVLVGQGKISGANMYMNESVNAQRGDSSNGVSGAQLPAGYHLTPSDATPNSPLDNFKISGNAQFKTVPVIGNSVDRNFAAHEIFIDGTNGGHSISQPVSVDLHGNVGDQVTLNPRKSTSDGSDDLENSAYSDYSPLNIPQNNNITVNFGWDSNDDTGTITPSSVHGLTYEKYPSNKSKGSLAGPVQVNFVDQNGNSIDNGAYTQIANYLPIGKQVNILNYTGTNSNTYTLNIPAGYKPDKAYSTNYTASATTPTKFTVHMMGNPVGNRVKLDITQKKINQDGTVTTVNPILKKEVDKLASNLRIGDSFAIRAGQFPIYHYAPLDNTPVQFNVVANEAGRAELQPTSNALFFYKYIPSDEMNAGNIYVSFVNQKGKYLNSDGTQTGNNGADIKETTISGTKHAGDSATIASDSPLREQGPAEVPFTAAKIPSGYHIVNNENVVYQFPQNDKHITLVVYGNSVNKTLNVSRELVDQNSNPIKALGNEPVQIIGNIGSDITVSTKSYTDANNTTTNFDSDGKYSLSGSDADEDISIVPGANGQGDITPNSVTFDYVKPVVQSKPITVEFINQNNKQVGQSFNLSGNVGSDVTVTNPAQGGENVPTGYSLAQYAVTNYQYKSSPYTAIVRVIGNPETNHVKIYRVLTNANGTTSVDASDANTPVNISGKTGDVETLYANNYKNSNYTPDESKPTSQQITINQAGDATTPGTVVFYYKSTKRVSQPVTIRFINQHGVKVGNDVNETGNVGSDTNILSDIGGSVGNKNASSLPQGYQLTNPGAKREVTFTNNQQVVTVGVTGNPISTSFKVYQYKENSDNEGTLNSDPVQIDGRVGDVIHVNPYDITYTNQAGQLHNSDVVPTGYHSANGNKDLDVTINGNGSITPINSIDYIYKKNYTAPDVGTINVHYVDSDASGTTTIPGVAGKFHEVDMESDHGTNNSNFDVTPYIDDVPENVSSQNYDLSIPNNPSQSVIYNKTNGRFNNSTQDIYIKVAKKNNLIIL